jgi:hypothetical protein
MATREKPVRQSVSLPPGVARRIRSIAKARNTSATRILVDLVQSGLAAHERAKERFMELAERLVESRDPAEQARIKKELAQLTFGE